MRARELLQPPHDLRAVLGGLLDDGERAADALVLQAAQHQLHAPDDDRQEIIEVVGGAARQLAQRAQRLALHQLLLHGLEIGERALGLVVEPGVFQRDAGEVGERAEVLQLGRGVAARCGGVEAQHPEHAVTAADRQAEVRDHAGLAVALAQRVASVVGDVVDEERLTGGRHAPGVAGAERQREIGRYRGARQRADTQGARLRVHDQQLDVWRAGDAGRLVHDLLERRQRIEAGHDGARGPQQRTQLVGAPHRGRVHPRAVERHRRLLREPGEQPRLALVVRVRLLPRHRQDTDQRVLGHERHGEDRADTLVSHRVAQQLAVGRAVEAVAGRLVLAPVRREERRAPQGGGADGALAGSEREEPVDGEAAAHAGHELL